MAGNGRCIRCGRPGHWASRCFAATDVDGLPLDDDDDDDDDGFAEHYDRTYSVYVIRLDDGAVYVGETGKSIEERFEEHRNGYKPGRVRGRRFVAIWERHCIRGLPSRDEAKRLEKQKSRELASAGYEVFGGH
jgi:predicted GIY-YIG superfamily endonuclease